jgi:hypothetical protein
MKAPKEEIQVLTKIDAARRQLETAIRLWFHNGDPYSIHCLAFAAGKVFHGICKHRKIEEPLLFNLKRIRKGMEGEYMKMIHAPSNFGKHADNDPEGTFDFRPAGGELLIFDAIESHKTLAQHITPLMTVFRFRFYLTHNYLWGKSIPAEVKQTFNVERLLRMSREEFFYFFYPTELDA